MNRRRNNWEDEEELRKPVRQEKDRLNKHRKAIYDMIDDEEDDEYFTDNYSYDYEDDEY